MAILMLGILLSVAMSFSTAQEHPINVAVGKPATQSSTFDGMDTWASPPVTYRASAELAVDGAPTKSYLNMTCAVTNWHDQNPYCTDNPWWQVDLGGLYDVFNVTIYQRGEGEPGAENHGPLVVWVGHHVERPENRTKYTDRPVVSVPLSPPVTTSTVNISIPGDSTLVQCEVEVLAVRHINECASNPCQHGGSCTDGLFNYSCTCVLGVTGANCETDISECDSSPCQHGATCRDLIGKFECVCPPGYTGIRCETDINECASSPCSPCSVRSRCVDGINSFQCLCPVGYTGAVCDQPVTSAPVTPSTTSGGSADCGGVACDNGGVCKMTPGGSTCVCSPGYTGLSCQSKCQTGWYGLECSQTCPSCQDGYSCHHVHGACPPRASPDCFVNGVRTGLGTGLGTSLLLALFIFVLLRCRHRRNTSSEKASANDVPMTSRQPVPVTRQQGAVSRDQETDNYESLDDSTKDRDPPSHYSGLGQASRRREAASPYSNEAA